MTSLSQPAQPSLREHTSRIRHLDAVRARELVALFRRPIPATGPAFADDACDQVVAATRGEVSLGRIGPDAAHGTIGHHATHLYLHEVIRVPLSVARQLAQHHGHLYLDKVTTLTDAVAAELGKHAGGGLSLNNLGTLSASAARSLGRHDGELSLNRLKRLSAAAARALGSRTGHLCLSGLKALSPSEAQLLSAHRGPLYLNAVEITDAVVHYLGQHRGSLSLSPPRGIVDHHLNSLIQHVGPLSLGGFRDVDQRTATILASQQGPRGIPGLSGLYLNDVQHVTPPVAAILATHRAGELSLNGIALLTEETARELVKHPLLSLDGITSVTDRVAGILASHAGGTLSLKGIRHASPSGLAKLSANPGIELSRRLRSDAMTPTGATVLPHPSREEMIAVIDRIARAGEHALSHE